MKFIKIFIALCLISVLSVPFIFRKSESYLRARSVQLLGAEGSCSGEQIRAPSGIDYILSAAHCSKLQDKNGSLIVKTEDNQILMRRIIAEDTKSDLLLIEGIPTLKGLDIAQSTYSKQIVRTFTHGNGLKTYKTIGELIQAYHVTIPLGLITSVADELACQDVKNKIVFDGMYKICALDVDEIISTAMTVPGSSGGMVVDASGDVVGVVSAGDGHFSLFVRLSDIQNFIEAY